jgi:hypothetical protein
MQSPLTFDLNKSHSPYNPVAQMYLTSPVERINQSPNIINGVAGLNGSIGDEEHGGGKEAERRVAIANGYGMFTPGRLFEIGS